ncbi:MAG TPA: butyrate kinase [Proteobacteria bacterium]|nr:butyrate kinase [Pseudomonadota bacterium]
MILAINVGSTTLKLVLDKMDGASPKASTLPLEIHDHRELYSDEGFSRLAKRLQERIGRFLRQHHAGPEKLRLVVARGGLQKPGPAAVFQINEAMCEDLSSGRYGRHPSSLGPLLAFTLARDNQIAAYTMDPPSTDEFAPPARFSGLPEIKRRCAFHALSHKAAGRRAATILEKDYEACSLVVAHMGGGITIGAHLNGRVVDCTNGLSEGPFTPERTGSLPTLELCALVAERQLNFDAIKQMLVGNGGLKAYLGTNNGLEIEARIKQGDQPAREVFEALSYQIAKEVGAMATVLQGACDAVVLTGGLAKSQFLLDNLRPRISFLGRILVFPEDEEMRSLCERGREILAQRLPITSYA